MKHPCFPQVPKQMIKLDIPCDNKKNKLDT
jgi:hypothetical protein